MGLQVLIIGGTPENVPALADHLMVAGMRVQAVARGAEVARTLAEHCYDVVICFVERLDESGFSVAARLRMSSDAGLIMLTDHETREHRVLALSLGVDHYLQCPEDLQEVVVLTGNLHRRVRPTGGAQGGAVARTHADDRWSFDSLRWTLTSPHGQVVTLSLSEHVLVDALLSRSGQVVPRAELLAVLNRGSDNGEGRSIDMIVSRLRRKVERASGVKVPIVSARGLGYAFAGPADKF